MAIRYCGLRDGIRILDVGCGKGWLLRRIASQFDVQATGLEIYPTFAAEARRLVVAEISADRIEIVEGPALEFHPEPASFDVVMCIGASFALNGFESALDWMSQAAKRGGAIALGEVFAKELPYPPEVPRGGRADLDYPERSLLTTVETIRAHGLPLRGIIEASTDDWDRYHPALASGDGLDARKSRPSRYGQVERPRRDAPRLARPPLLRLGNLRSAQRSGLSHYEH